MERCRPTLERRAGRKIGPVAVRLRLRTAIDLVPQPPALPGDAWPRESPFNRNSASPPAEPGAEGKDLDRPIMSLNG